MTRLREVRRLSFRRGSHLAMIAKEEEVNGADLVVETFRGAPAVCLFIKEGGRTSLYERFVALISRTLSVCIPRRVSAFGSLFQCVVRITAERSFGLIVSRFRRFCGVGGSVCDSVRSV